MDWREMGAPQNSEGDVFWDLLSFVSHHRQGNVLAHVVQLIS